MIEERFRLDIQKKFFAAKVERHCSRLPGKVGNVPSLELFMAMLDGALSKLVYWNVSQPMAEGLELMIFPGPFEPKLFCDSVASNGLYIDLKPL